MGRHLGNDDDGKGLGGDEHLLERAVLMVRREHSRERQERREKRRHPDNAGGNGAKDVGFRADAERNERHDDGEEEDHLSEIGLSAQRQREIAAKNREEEIKHDSFLPLSGLGIHGVFRFRGGRVVHGALNGGAAAGRPAFRLDNVELRLVDGHFLVRDEHHDAAFAHVLRNEV